MNGPENYASAERWLFKAQHPSARGGDETAGSCAAIAQVHATLALTAAHIDGVAIMRPEDRDEWDRATGRLQDPPEVTR
jgi:hypothetical protein